MVIPQSYVPLGDHFVLNRSDGTSLTVYYCQTGNQLLMRGAESGFDFVYQLSR